MKIKQIEGRVVFSHEFCCLGSLRFIEDHTTCISCHGNPSIFSRMDFVLNFLLNFFHFSNELVVLFLVGFELLRLRELLNKSSRFNLFANFMNSLFDDTFISHRVVRMHNKSPSFPFRNFSIHLLKLFWCVFPLFLSFFSALFDLVLCVLDFIRESLLP